MSSTYSVINDLYGVEAARSEPKHQDATWLLVLLALAAIFVFESVHPVTQLRSNPPADFAMATATPKASLGTAQESIARAYWDVAAGLVSKRYSYGDTLPSSPPQDFTLASDSDYGTRALYWQRFRKVWNEQAVWVTSYKLNVAWINGVLDSASNFAYNYLDINI